ncbi:MAG: ABC transporter permease [Planctomycetota bacterium]|jgi:lipoprotein-releasing system permease protein
MMKWYLAWRYFIKRPISILAVVAVALCVFIVIVVMTVMNGLVTDFKEKNHAYAGDCVIECDSLVGFGYYEDFLTQLASEPSVAAASPVVRGMGLMTQPGAKWNIGIEIHGIDPAAHSNVTGFAQTLHYRKDTPADAFKPQYAPDLPGCVVGIDMMPRRRNADGGYAHAATPPAWELVLSSFPLNVKGGLARAGTSTVSTHSFYFSDDSHSGLVKVDGAVVYVPIETAQILCGMDSPFKRVSDIHIKFADGVTVDQGTETVRTLWNKYIAGLEGKPGTNLFDNVRVQTWHQNRRSIIAPMEKEQTMMTMLFLMLGVITVFIIFVVLYMIISHKSKDIGILKSIGVTTREILSVFMMFAVFVGASGATLGGLGGWIFLLRVNHLEDWLHEKFGWQLWDRTMYAIGDIPNEVNPAVLGTIVASAIIACMVGALVPSLQAAMRKPAQSLQVNQM